MYCFCSWLSATAITLTTTHSPCRRGLAAVGRVRAAPHPPLPLRGECVAHTSSNQHITLLSTPLFSSHFLSSLLSCYSSTKPLFFHTHLHTPIYNSHTHAAVLKHRLSITNSASGSITQLQSLLDGMGYWFSFWLWSGVYSFSS